MHYVYIIKSTSHPDQAYVGCTSNLKQRLSLHNVGNSPHTKKYKPWQLQNYFAFPDKMQAFNFERYLKSHSGRAFSKKHFYS